jgi:predicted enzyme related to lactoylglutathione lyase
MTSRVRWIDVDCADPYALSGFWAEVIGHPRHQEDRPDDDECAILIPGQTGMLFQRVPEGKAVKNRIHLDISPTDRTREEELERLLALGATILDDRRREAGTGWVVMADPEGNEFCLERRRDD